MQRKNRKQKLEILNWIGIMDELIKSKCLICKELYERRLTINCQEEK